MLRVISMLLALLCLTTANASADGGEYLGGFLSMKRVSKTSGWFASGRQVFWTNDNGTTWRNITPQLLSQSAIASVYFVDASTGFLLETGPAADPDDTVVRVSHTLDGGQHWQTQVFVPPGVDTKSWTLDHTGDIYFLDAKRGWIDLGMVSSAAAKSGLLLETRDGGATWTWPTGQPSGPSSGTISFNSDMDGWVLNPFLHELSGTHDGGKTWDFVTLPVPDGLGPANFAFSYHLPIFDDAKHGHLLVAYKALNESSAFHVECFVTDDGGRIWRPQVSLLDVPNSGTPLPVTTVGDRIVSVEANDGGLSLRQLAASASVANQADKPHRPFAARSTMTHIGAISFFSEREGWVLRRLFTGSGNGYESADLVATEDGGATWRDIMPPRAPHAAAPGTVSSVSTISPPNTTMESGPHDLPTTPPGSKNLQSFNPARRFGFPRLTQTASSTNVGIPSTPGSAATIQSQPLASSTTRSIAAATALTTAATTTYVSRHLGFDTAISIDATDMSTWWGSSPYFDAYIYLPGGRRTVDPNVTSSWILAIRNQGWSIVPIWYGAQAPCVSNSPTSSRFDSVVANALAAGVAEADAAIASAVSRSISGSGQIIYKDIEQYTPGATNCSPAVQAFLSGWVGELHTQGWAAGVYGNPGPASVDFAVVAPAPDNIWIAKYPAAATTPSSVSTLGLSPLCDPFAASGSCELWANDQRSRQYTNSHGEMWAGFFYQIDNDVDDASVYPAAPTTTLPVGVKGYSNVGSGTYDVAGFNYTTLTGISNLDPVLDPVLRPTHTAATQWIVGYYEDSPTLTTVFNGFIASGNVYTAFGPPTTISYPTAGVTVPSSVNNSGQVVGTYTNTPTSANTFGFFYSAGSYFSINYPGATDTYPSAINDGGLVAGTYLDTNAVSHGFVFNGAVGGASGFTNSPSNYFPIDNPLANTNSYNGTLVSSISGAGKIAGSYYSATGGLHAFYCVLDPKTGTRTFTAADVTGWNQTAIDALSNNGVALAYVQNSSGTSATYSFFLSELTGAYTIGVGLPAAWWTYGVSLSNINDDQQIVGSYQDINGYSHGGYVYAGLPPAGFPTPVRPSNDNFINAAPLTGTSGSSSLELNLATLEPGEPSIGGNPGGHSVWYAITPSTNEQIVVDTFGSAVGTAIGAFTGSTVSSLTQVASSVGDSQNGLVFQAQAGIPYHIAIDGVGGAAGFIYVNWSVTSGASADMSVSGPTATSIPQQAPQTDTYVVTNSGPNEASSVAFSLTFTPSITISPSDSRCSGTTTVTCALGTLPPGGGSTLPFTFTPTALGSLKRTATVTATTPDPIATNNSTTATDTVVVATSGSGGSADVPLPAWAIVSTGMLLAWQLRRMGGTVSSGRHRPKN